MKNRAFHTPLLYIIPSLPHSVSADYFWIRYQGKMVFLILVHVHDLHFNKTYTYPTSNLSYTNTSKLTWNKPLLYLFSQSLTLTLYPYSKPKKKKKGNTPIYLAHKIICYGLTLTYLPRPPSPFVNNLYSYYQSNAYLL